MATEEDSVQQAVARRERLRALKAAVELSRMPDEESTRSDDEAEPGDDIRNHKQNLKFRNYLPHDDQLQEGKLAPPVLPKFEDPIAATSPTEKNEDPFVNIAPKKPNWDLRRDVQKKLDKLERRTQKAMYKLREEEEKQKQAAEETNGDENTEA